MEVLAFDIMGTLFDWHSGVARACREVAQHRGDLGAVDWDEFAQAYRRRSLVSIKGAVHPGVNSDEVLDHTLTETLQEFACEASSAEHAAILAAWRNLPLWSDVTEDLRRLATRFRIVPFTVVSHATTVALSELHEIDWDEIISCESCGIYKTNPGAYDHAAQQLLTSPANITLVACHDFALEAAAQAGFETVYISRPGEWGSVPAPSTGSNILVHHDSITAFAAAQGC